MAIYLPWAFLYGGGDARGVCALLNRFGEEGEGFRIGDADA